MTFSIRLDIRLKQEYSIFIIVDLCPANWGYCMAHKVIVIEDEATIADLIKHSLEKEGFEVTIAEDGVAGLASARSLLPDVILLDITLPKMSGFDLCQMLRQESRVPIIMLTGKSDEIDRVLGLELGADDYMVKPFSTRELIARIKAILRRTTGGIPEESRMQLKAGGICLDLGRRRVTIDSKAIHLPLKQFELLRVLMAHRNEVMSRDHLLKSVWNSEDDFDTGTLDVHIRWLRKKIEKEPADPKWIRTVRGLGYKFVCDREDDSK